MASRLGKHLLRAKCKTENFGLSALYTCYFCFDVWLLHGKLLTIIDKKLYIWVINFWSKGNSEEVGLYT